MKKLAILLGLSFLLTACFEQPKPKVEKAEVENVKAEETEAIVSSESILQDSVANVAENEQIQILKKENEPGSAPSSEEIMPKETLKASPVAIKKATKTEERPSIHNVNSSNKAKTKVRVAKSEGRNVRTRVEDHFDYNSIGLSPEERRLFSQSSGGADLNALTDIDIMEMKRKRKCRYPFMTESEIISYHCGVKPVSFK